ncbi:MAG: hypothetical protein HQM03_09165 [Magnetococcales bacterium]|nr:hypothetical protein [Magnetococcales bacterium]
MASAWEWPPETGRALAERIVYGGNPDHKVNPVTYGFAPPGRPRPAKTLCDAHGPFAREMAETFLREGARKGMVSRQTRNGFPQNIWFVSPAGTIYEAQLENQAQGSYHGYPLPTDDPFGETVRKEWSNR